MATLKKLTRVGADVRQIARLLQAKAPEGHMLAYITPEEAELLKSQGGSGKEHADTGIPSYQMDVEGFEDVGAYMPETSPAPPQVTNLPSAPAEDYTQAYNYQPAGQSRITEGELTGPSGVTLYGSASQLPSYAGESTFPTAVSTAPYTGEMGQYAGAFPAGSFETQPGVSVQPYRIDTTPEKGIMERLSESTGLSKETLGRLGLAGGLGLYGAYKSKKSEEEAKKAKEEQQALARPYQAKGAELQRQAQAGELTPVGQQQLQAVQAQAAQQAAGRGGAVSAAQTQAQIEAFRNQLLQQQYDYGLKLSGIGDNIALGAIKTGLEADRYVQQLSNSFYTNMANIVGGMPAQTPQQYRSA
jgi:hypothetical protein